MKTTVVHCKKEQFDILEKGKLMKKLLLALIIVLITTTAFAENNIPGFFEIETYYARHYNTKAPNDAINNIGSTAINFKYGGQWSDLKIYVFAGWNTFYENKGTNYYNNYPYRDIYTCGSTVEYSIFYVKWDHTCSHGVVTERINADIRANYTMFRGMPALAYDTIKIGLKIKID